MKFLFSVFFFIVFVSFLVATIINVPADQPTIQEGIEVAVDSDTVLVQPDTYIENINFNGKNITVASLYLTTQDTIYISETVIDGDSTGSVITFVSGEDSTAVLIGFTLTNGRGSYFYENMFSRGGGILSIETNPTIKNCIIENNLAEAGAGIYLDDSIINLSGVTIRNNFASVSGGAIFLFNNANIVFNQTNLCDIYLNYSPHGCEILRGYYQQQGSPISVVVDTFTVFNPDSYFVFSGDPNGQQVDDININSLNAYLTPINHDLYVSPEGNNNNSGLTPNDPLKTIYYAQSLIQPDSIECNTIFLADGVYENNLDDQFLPISMRSFTNIEGQSKIGTILDGDNVTQILTDSHSEFNYSIRNLTFRNGYEDFSTAYCALSTHDYQSLNSSLVLDNLNFENNQSTISVVSMSNLNISINDVFLENNEGGAILKIYQTDHISHDVYITNCIIQDNTQHLSPDVFSMTPIVFSSDFNNQAYLNIQMINSLITENIDSNESWPISACGFSVGNKVDLTIVNSTIGNNEEEISNGAAVILFGADTAISFINTIVYGNEPHNLYILNNISSLPSTINIQNSLIENGEAGIVNNYEWNDVNWLDNNYISDPLWLGDGAEFPYALSEGSPCIDTGTLDLPPGIELPEYDLAGNPRIYDDLVDMGAYEWQGVEISEDTIQPEKIELFSYPNPFNPTTTISFSIPEESKIELTVYNIKGQKVKTLVNTKQERGHYNVVWNGKDGSDRSVASGLYFYKLQAGKKAIVNKMLLLK